jgi:hypothetical protein
MRFNEMKKIASGTELRNVILQLENRKILQEQLLKEQFRITTKSLKLAGIIRNVFMNAVASDEVQDDIIIAAANLIAGFLSKRMMKGSSDSEWKKYLDKLLHHGIATIVSKNSDTIRIIGECFIDSFIMDKRKQD